jgi:dolichol-phosphate mannosyltransferase
MSHAIILATYEEAENIVPLVRSISSAAPEAHIVIVDDNSPDGTGRLADEQAKEDPLVHVIHRPRKMGLGTAHLEGFSQALALHAELVVTMDADFSHDPSVLPALFGAAEKADLVLGSRYAAGGGVLNWAWPRRFLSRFANIYIRLITGVPLADMTTGFRCYRRRLVQQLLELPHPASGYAFLVETACRAFWAGMEIGQVPIIFTERRAGRTKLSFGVLLESALLPWRLRLQRFMARRPAL